MADTVLVTGAGGASGLYTIKVLKETSSVRVIGADASPHSAGLYLADRGVVLPKATETELFMRAVRALVAEESIDIILPNVDEELPHFADNRYIGRARAIVSPLDSILVCGDKWEMLRKLASVVPCPRTVTANRTDELPDWPIHIKPRISRGSRNIYLASDAHELEFYMKYLAKRGYAPETLLLQEFLPGMEYTVDALFGLQGELVVAVPRERVRTSGGLSHTGRTVRHPELLEYTRIIGERMRFEGPINLQFREDGPGVPRLLEINPRFSGGLPIVVASGANMPRILLGLVEGRRPMPEELNWREGFVYRYLEERFVDRADLARLYTG